MDSVNIGHVPPPNPENYWDFKVGQTRVLIDMTTSLRLIEVDFVTGPRARFAMSSIHFPTQVDWLNLDRPCVAIAMPDGEPGITVTLRKIEVNIGSSLDNKAWLQVTANPNIGQGPRADPNG